MMPSRWLLLCTAGLLAAAEPGFRAEVIGGTLAEVPVKTAGRIDLTRPEAMIFHVGKLDWSIVYSHINTLEYGQNVSRHYAAAILISPIILLSKSRKHFVTVGYLDSNNAQQVLVYRVDKRDIRPFLAAIEARSGRRVEFQDDEARKAGKE